MGILSNILQQSQLSGGVYFCHTFTHKWGLDIKAPKSGTFHILISGEAKLGYKGKTINLEAGDIITLPKACPHWIALSEKIKRTPIVEFRQSHMHKPFNNKVSDSDVATLLCGYFNFNDPTNFPLFSELPDCIHIQSKPEDNINWLQSLVKRMNVEAVYRPIGSTLYLNRQVELLFVDIIRHWLAQNGANNILLKAAKNPMILKTLRLFHANPESNFDLESLALEVGMSRASLSKYFTEIIGISPMAYLSKWRVYVASNLLVSTNLRIIDIAISVGYSSVSSLSKKFKAEIGISPRKYRMSHLKNKKQQ